MTMLLPSPSLRLCKTIGLTLQAPLTLFCQLDCEEVERGKAGRRWESTRVVLPLSPAGSHPSQASLKLDLKLKIT